MPSSPTPSEALAEQEYQTWFNSIEPAFRPVNNLWFARKAWLVGWKRSQQAVAQACAETAEKQVCAHDCERDYTGRHSAFCAHGIATAIRTRFGVEG